MKRIFCFGLALLLCASLFYTAFATAGTDIPGTDIPGTDTPGTDTPGTDTPGTDTPGTDTPGTDTPGTDTPGTDTPGTDTPGTDTPGTDTPGTDTPGTDTPGTDTPGTDTPGTDKPGTDKPGFDFLHIHKFSSTWNADEDNHWHECIHKGCTETIDTAPHVYKADGWVTDENGHWQTCLICGYRSGNSPHKWDGGKVTKAATCVSAGTKTYTCTVCGATKTESLPLTNHSWDGGTTTIQPTITEKGESLFKCILCGKTTTREIPPLGQTMMPEELLTLVAKPGNALNGRLDDEQWVVLQAVTTEEEYTRIQAGWPITVTLEVEDVTDTISSSIMQKVQESAKNRKIYCALHMVLTKQMYEEATIPVTETTEPIIVALSLPEEILRMTSRRKERGFTVYRVDGEDIKKVTAKLSDDGESLRLQTDSFGTYVLTYQDQRTHSIDPVVFLYGGLALVTLGGIGFLVYKLFFAKNRFIDDDENEDESEDDIGGDD